MQGYLHFPQHRMERKRLGHLCINGKADLTSSRARVFRTSVSTSSKNINSENNTSTIFIDEGHNIIVILYIYIYMFELNRTFPPFLKKG
jgi:hypothetical protein